MEKINYHKFSRILDKNALIDGKIIDIGINDLEKIVYVIQLKSSEKVAMVADHFCDGTTEINFYDLII